MKNSGYKRIFLDNIDTDKIIYEFVKAEKLLKDSIKHNEDKCKLAATFKQVELIVINIVKHETQALEQYDPMSAYEEIERFKKLTHNDFIIEIINKYLLALKRTMKIRKLYEE